MNTYFEGITVPVLTPCTEDGRLDEKRLCEHIQFLERAGVKVLLGTEAGGGAAKRGGDRRPL